MPSFRRVLEAIDEAWRERRVDLDEQASRLTAALAEAASPDPAAALPGPEVLAVARAELGRGFEPRYGGFGGAPKFPPSMALRFLLRDHVRTGDQDSLDMARTTLDAMAAGGLRDHVGGGFHRYSVDDTWLVPHFEKMLYDQALIVRAYTQGFQVTGEQRWKIVVEELIEYVLRDLRTDGGGFASAEDADSEGIEGKFYVWSVEELRDVLGDDAQVVIDYFGASPQGNFEGGNILHVADRTRPRPTEVERSLPLLREVRSRRVRPGLDNKVLLAWNALFARALAEAAAVFERDDWLDAARTTVEFLESSLRSADGRLLRSWQGGQARHHAYAEDYAALLGAQLTLAELDDMAWVERARSTASHLVDLFHDPDSGGFFTSGADADELLVRGKDFFDNATPSANSMAADALLRLAALTGEKTWEAPALSAIRVVGDHLERMPTGFGEMLEALERAVVAPLEIVVTGDPTDRSFVELRRGIVGRLLPAAVMAVGGPGDGSGPLHQGRGGAGPPRAYVCENFACREPVETAPDLRRLLDGLLSARDQPGFERFG
ncbi:MAG: AGE family epimerase/isomerase [Acidimicrobiia bacterium]|nr:AGE family epimerase/isomerase [Acidimicrobiia bacterium]